MVQVGRVTQRVEHQAFRYHGDQGHHDGGAEHAPPVVQAEFIDDVEGRVGAGHVEGAVREIGHVQDAVHQREPERDEAVDAAQGESVQDLLQEKLQNLSPFFYMCASCGRGIAFGCQAGERWITRT